MGGSLPGNLNAKFWVEHCGDITWVAVFQVNHMGGSLPGKS